tara:strand:+ start:187 stop:333 length:147 start_codon:yes stop_codon:yes gene_type:complete
MNYIVAVQGKKWVQYKMYRLFDDMKAKYYLQNKYKDKLVAIYPIEREL